MARDENRCKSKLIKCFKNIRVLKDDRVWSRLTQQNKHGRLVNKSVLLTSNLALLAHEYCLILIIKHQMKFNGTHMLTEIPAYRKQ